MEFASEMLVKASLFGFASRKYPPIFLPMGAVGRRICALGAMAGATCDHAPVSPRWLFLYPGSLLMLIGTVLGIWLLPGLGCLVAGHRTWNTCLYCAVMILIGYQGVIFAVFLSIRRHRGFFLLTKKFSRILKYISLEAGLLVVRLGRRGTGISISLRVLARRRLRPLNPDMSYAWSSPGPVFLSIGCQTIFSSSFSASWNGQTLILTARLMFFVAGTTEVAVLPFALQRNVLRLLLRSGMLRNSRIRTPIEMKLSHLKGVPSQAYRCRCSRRSHLNEFARRSKSRSASSSKTVALAPPSHTYRGLAAICFGHIRVAYLVLKKEQNRSHIPMLLRSLLRADCH